MECNHFRKMSWDMGHMRKCGWESDSPKTLQSTRMRQVVPVTGINVANADVF